MMMNAYSELYLDDAMCNLGEMFDYAINDCKIEPDMFFDIFVASEICACFEEGNPKYVAGKSGVELAKEVWENMTGESLEQEYAFVLDRSPEYWAGWSLAYYQWLKNIRFKDLLKYDISLGEIISMYILHEADISKFVDAVDFRIDSRSKLKESQLKRIRKYHELTQRALSEKSGVTLRMIQLYEQKQNDLSKAQASVVLSLAQALGCEVKDLIE